MHKTLKDFWISFRFHGRAIWHSGLLFLSGLVLGYFAANCRYEQQTYNVDADYAFEYLTEQGVEVVPLAPQNFSCLVETGMGDAVLSVLDGQVVLSRLYEYKFDPACSVTRHQLLDVFNAARLRGTGAITALLAFDDMKATVLIGNRTGFSRLGFQKAWPGLLKGFDINDKSLDKSLEDLVGRENLQRTLVAPTDYGRVFNEIQFAQDVGKDLSPRAIQGMLDMMQKQ